MEDRDGQKGPTCEHGEDKDYGVWHLSGRAEEIWKVPLVSVSQELVALMQSSVVAASAGCIRNEVALRDPWALTLSSGKPDALGLLGLSMKEKFQRLRLEMKSLKLSQSSATLGTCSLQVVAASWLRSHAANVHGASSANCFPFSPTAICPF